MPMRVYPPKGELRGRLGLNLADYILDVSPDELVKGRNYYFFRTTKRRRRAFRRYSTEDWSGTSFKGGLEFLDTAGNARLLVGLASGKVKEIQSASASADVVTGLGTDRDIQLAVAHGAVFMANGDDTLRRIDATSNPAVACTSRVAGAPAKVTGFTAVAGAAGVRTGDYAFMATAVIEVGGAKVLESDWSTVVEVTLAATKVNFGWTNPAASDSRVTHVYIYGTRAGGATPFFIRKVAVPTASYTGDDTADSALGVTAPLLGVNGVPPTAPEDVAFSGNRLVLRKGRSLYFSRVASNAYDLERFQTQIDAPYPGPIRAHRTIPSAGGVIGTNSLWFAQETSCHILDNSDPTTPIRTLSSDTGCIGKRAHASRGKWLFWVDRKKGIIFWPGEGMDLYVISEKINPAFTGGGNQSLTANQSDDDITLTVWNEMLLVTVRDDSTKACANKVYAMSLLKFARGLMAVGPEAAAEWIGPWDGPGFYHFVTRMNGGLYLLDNESKYLSQWDTSSFKDYVDGADAVVASSVKSGPCLAELKWMNHMLHYFHLYAYNNDQSTLTITGEQDRVILSGLTLSARNYGIPVEDIPLVDIETISESWKSETPIDWGIVANWFQFEIENQSETSDMVYSGFQVRHTSRRLVGVMV